MTEQSKIPLPDEGPQEEPEAGPSKRKSATLIERVVRNYDLVKFAPAAIPEGLIQPASARRRYHRADEVIEVVEALTINESEFTASPAPEEQEVVLDETSRSAPVVAPTEAGGLVRQPAPVVFKGEHHPLNRQHLRDQGLIVPESSVTAVLEEFRIVKRQLLRNADQLAQQGMGPAAQRVLICSPHPGEGKSFTSVNLALAIAAEKECEVLLVDADFAKPSVLSMLGLPGGPGLMDALANPEIDAADCVIGTDVPGLWVLPAGNATTSDTEYLSSARTRTVLDRLVQGAPQRFVIFDSPPALAASPAAALANYVGQAVVVARCDKTEIGRAHV